MKYNLLLFTILFLTGCAVGPDYKKPKTELPAQWRSGQASDVQMQQDWWRNFNDPVLDRLIEKASRDNLDIQIAESRIMEARATRSSAFSSLLPTINGRASAERQANRIAFPGGLGGVDLKKPFSTYEAGFDASWELDIFGGKQRELEAANAELRSVEAKADDTKISLYAEIARTYYDIRQYQVQLAITDQIINSSRKSLDIAEDRYRSGTTSRADVTTTEAALEQARSQQPDYQNMIAQAEYGMDVLLGEQPGYTHNITGERKLLAPVDDNIILAAPAKIIANRPDIKIAERKLAAATAKQGVAIAELFPDISLSGFIGLLNVAPEDLATADSRSWSGGARVLLPILNYGRIASDIDLADANQTEALAQYKKSVINALSDVERSVTALNKDRQKSSHLEITAQNDEHSIEIADSRYKQGLTSMQEVLDAQQIYYLSQRRYIESQTKIMQDMAALYKSLGGGWKTTQ